MAYPIDDRCGGCEYYRMARNNQIALRWSALVVSTAIPLLAGWADIFVKDWNISAMFATFYAVGVLGLVMIAYQPHLYAFIKSKVQQ